MLCWSDCSVKLIIESAEPSGRTEMPHADILLKVSILTAWAELHIASFAHRYLEEVTKPNLSILATLWISILRDYAKVKLEPDVLSAASGDPSARSSMDSYLEATRNVVLPVRWTVLNMDFGVKQRPLTTIFFFSSIARLG